MQEHKIQRNKENRKFTFRLQKISLLHPSSKCLVELGVEDRGSGSICLVVGHNVLLQGLTTSRNIILAYTE